MPHTGRDVAVQSAKSSVTPVTSSCGPPRIAYVTSSHGLGGAEELIASLVEEGQTRGCEQLVLVPFAVAASSALADRCPGATYEEMGCQRLWQLPALRRWVRQRLAAFAPDLIHVTLFHATVLMAGVRRGRERRVLTHAYGEGIRQLSYPRTRMRLDRWAAGRFDHVSAISDSVHSFLTGVHGYPPPPIGRIILGWRGEPLRREHREGADPTVVCVAALRHEKGHDVLLKAFSIVRREVPRARLVLVGGGPGRQELEEQVRTAGLHESVEFVGLVPDIWTYLRDADVFAVASHNEALGIAIMEAMAAGLPVVASDVGGIPEVVEAGVTGELFAVGDHVQLARHLSDLLRSPERRGSMSAAAETAARSMHMHESVRKYFDLYGELLSDCRLGATARG